MIAVVAIDKWKLATFERCLREAGFSWTQHEGLVPGSWSLRVEVEDLSALVPVVVAANRACAS